MIFLSKARCSTKRDEQVEQKLATWNKKERFGTTGTSGTGGTAEKSGQF
jgi:hypothetical protein